jgi:hypothetical protein
LRVEASYENCFKNQHSKNDKTNEKYLSNSSRMTKLTGASRGILVQTELL